MNEHIGKFMGLTVSFSVVLTLIRVYPEFKITDFELKELHFSYLSIVN